MEIKRPIESLHELIRKNSKGFFSAISSTFITHTIFNFTTLLILLPLCNQRCHLIDKT